MKHRRILAGLAAVLALMPFARLRTVQAQREPKRVEVVAKRFSFEPADVTLKKDEPVVLVLRSEDVSHGLRFRDLNVDVRAAKGGVSEVRFTPERTGDFVGHCSVFCGSGHGTMMLTLHVVD